MAIYKGDKRAVLYKGDYRPAELYKGNEKAAGYTVETVSGRSAKVDDTYNDLLDISVQGHHTQDTQAERKVDFVGTAEFVANEESYLGAAVFEGRHEQKKYTGRNLLQFATNRSLSGGILYTVENGVIHAEGTATASPYFNFDFALTTLEVGQTYTAKVTAVGERQGNFTLYFGYYDENGSSHNNIRGGDIGNGATQATFTVPTGYAKNRFWLTATGTGNSVNADFYIELVKGSSVPTGDFEPFVGGKPSPSPSYPQPIEAVQDERMEVRGKNLFDISKVTNGTRSGVNVTIEGKYIHLVGTPTSTYAIMFDAELPNVIPKRTRVTLLSEGHESGVSYYLRDINKTNAGGMEDGKTSTPSADVYYFRIVLTQQREMDIRLRIMISEGTTATPFEPFHSPSSISHSLTLYGDGTTNDSFDMVTGKYTKWWEKISLPISAMNNSENYAGWKGYPECKKIASIFPQQNAPLDHVSQGLVNIGVLSDAQYGTRVSINTLNANSVLFVNTSTLFGEKLTQSEVKAKYPDLVFELLYKLPAAEVSYLDPSTVELIDGTNLLSTQPPATGSVILDPLKPSPLFPTEIKGTEGAEVEVSGENGERRQTLPFTLYGANGIFDTCEPCVLVDGVERCRVTRRWRREIVSPSLSWEVAERRNGFIRFYAPFTGMSREDDVCVLSTIAEGVKFSDITSMRLHGVSNYTGSSRLYFCVSDSYDLDSFKAMLSNDKPEIVYRLAEPSVEYYDPLPLSTIPHCTIINSSADFTAAVKKVEK